MEFQTSSGVFRKVLWRIFRFNKIATIPTSFTTNPIVSEHLMSNTILLFIIFMRQASFKQKMQPRRLQRKGQTIKMHLNKQIFLCAPEEHIFWLKEGHHTNRIGEMWCIVKRRLRRTRMFVFYQHIRNVFVFASAFSLLGPFSWWCLHQYLGKHKIIHA